MSGEIITGIQLAFYAIVIICLGLILNKLERIGNCLAEQTQLQKKTVSMPMGTFAADSRGTAQATDDEIAAVMAVIAKLMPDKQVASVRMVSK